MTEGWKPAVGDRVTFRDTGPYVVALIFDRRSPVMVDLRFPDGTFARTVLLPDLTPYVPGAYPGDAVDEAIRLALALPSLRPDDAQRRTAIIDILRSLPTVEPVEKYEFCPLTKGIGTPTILHSGESCSKPHLPVYVERRPHEHTPGEPTFEPYGGLVRASSIVGPNSAGTSFDGVSDAYRKVTRCTECGEEV